MTFTDWDGKKYLVKVKSYNIFKTISAADTKYHYLCSVEHPRQSHRVAVKCIFGYLKGTLGFCIFYQADIPDFKLLGYTNADFGADIDDCKSRTGFVFTLSRAAIEWGSKKQSHIF